MVFQKEPQFSTSQRLIFWSNKILVLIKNMFYCQMALWFLSPMIWIMLSQVKSMNNKLLSTAHFETMKKILFSCMMTTQSIMSQFWTLEDLVNDNDSTLILIYIKKSRKLSMITLELFSSAGNESSILKNVFLYQIQTNNKK